MFLVPLCPSSGARDYSVGYHIGRLVLELLLDGSLSTGRMDECPDRRLLTHEWSFRVVHITACGPGSSVGIATELRAGRSGIESRWGRDFPPDQTGPGAHPVSCKMDTGSLPGVKCGRGVLLTTHPLLVPRSWKSRAIPLPTLWATPGL